MIIYTTKETRERLKLKMPNEQYKNNWWKEEYYNSPQGKAFEKQIANFCIEVIKKEYV